MPLTFWYMFKRYLAAKNIAKTFRTGLGSILYDVNGLRISPDRQKILLTCESHSNLSSTFLTKIMLIFLSLKVTLEETIQKLKQLVSLASLTSFPTSSHYRTGANRNRMNFARGGSITERQACRPSLQKLQVLRL